MYRYISHTLTNILLLGLKKRHSEKITGLDQVEIFDDLNGQIHATVT